MLWCPFNGHKRPAKHNSSSKALWTSPNPSQKQVLVLVKKSPGNIFQRCLKDGEEMERMGKRWRGWGRDGEDGEEMERMGRGMSALEEKGMGEEK